MNGTFYIFNYVGKMQLFKIKCYLFISNRLYLCVILIDFQIRTFGTQWLWKNYFIELYCRPFTIRFRRNKTQRQTYIRHWLYATSKIILYVLILLKIEISCNCFIKELALHNELSIKETFTYYGYIFNLSDDVIKKRGQELKELLKLPSYSLRLNEVR